MLEADPDSLLLWDAYARVAPLKQARKTYARVLGQLHDRPGAARMWRSWAEMEWDQARPDLAVEILACSVGAADAAELKRIAAAATDRAAVKPTTVLRTRKALAERTDTDGVCAAALFEYLIDGLEAAMTLLDARLADRPDELVYIFYARLLHRHTRLRTIYRPVSIRAALERGIALFPHNSIILSVFAAVEAQFRVECRLKTVLDDQLRDEASASTWLYRIHVELNIVATGYSAAAVRSLFERAVEALRSRPSVDVWLCYVEFEAIQQRDLRRAKAVLTRAVESCPWSKGASAHSSALIVAADLYLAAFEHLRPAYTPSQLTALADLMSERVRLRSLTWLTAQGLRLHIDPAPAIAAISGQALLALEGGDDDEGRADADYLARLYAPKPY